MVERATKIKEAFDSYKYKIEVEENASVHVMPKANERIGKFLDLRENKGQEIEDYWTKLCEQYSPEVMAPYEPVIRG
jgi:hypothetical protein